MVIDCDGNNMLFPVILLTVYNEGFSLQTFFILLDA